MNNEKTIEFTESACDLAMFKAHDLPVKRYTWVGLAILVATLSPLFAVAALY
jgi:hypothetical protein